jgi:HK97 gp10 family phage protein
MARRKAQVLAHGDFQVEIEGFDELEKKLEQLADIYDTVESLLQALEEGAKIIQRAAQENAPGEIRTQREVNTRKAKIGVSIGFPRKKWFYMFFETGVQPHEISPKDRQALKLAGGDIVARVLHHPGMAARPFLRPALDNRGDEAVKAVAAALWKKVDKLLDKG